MKKGKEEKIISIYKGMLHHFGPPGWWPAETSFEVIIGAILTQNTNWSNVEKAIKNLKENNCLNPHTLLMMDERLLSQIIKPSGFYKIKASRIKEFINYLFKRHDGDISGMFTMDPYSLRKELLSIRGIGPETADSILLYAGGMPFFVVDSYTKRILSRHGAVEMNASYDRIQSFFHENLPRDSKLFNEFHALFVATGKYYCRKNPNCDPCPLNKRTLWGWRI